MRNPIYTSLLLMVLGPAMEKGELQTLLALPLATLGFWLKLKQEERFLVRRFPEAYPAYCERVKALVPGIW